MVPWGGAGRLGSAGVAQGGAARQALDDGIGPAAIAGGVAVLVAAVAAARRLARGGVVPPSAHPGYAGSPEEGAAGDVVDEEVVTPSPILD